jgi:hypothetical protein
MLKYNLMMENGLLFYIKKPNDRFFEFLGIRELLFNVNQENILFKLNNNNIGLIRIL